MRKTRREHPEAGGSLMFSHTEACMRSPYSIRARSLALAVIQCANSAANEECTLKRRDGRVKLFFSVSANR